MSALKCRKRKNYIQYVTYCIEKLVEINCPKIDRWTRSSFWLIIKRTNNSWYLKFCLWWFFLRAIWEWRLSRFWKPHGTIYWRRNLSLRHKNRKWPMKSLDSREVNNDITWFLYLWRSDKIRRIGRIVDMNKTTPLKM